MLRKARGFVGWEKCIKKGYRKQKTCRGTGDIEERHVGKRYNKNYCNDNNRKDKLN